MAPSDKATSRIDAAAVAPFSAIALIIMAAPSNTLPAKWLLSQSYETVPITQKNIDGKTAINMIATILKAVLTPHTHLNKPDVSRFGLQI